MTIWLVSDTHFMHRGMAEEYVLADGSRARPFTSVEEMDEHMIDRWNSVVRPSDHVYHLGDFTMIRGSAKSAPVLHAAGILARLRGHKRIVLGNHDAMPTKWYLENGFEKVFGVRVMDNLVLTHIPIAPWSLERFDANVHGHVHTSAPKITHYQHVPLDGSEGRIVKYVNLSVEAIDYTPVSLETIKSWL